MGLANYENCSASGEAVALVGRTLRYSALVVTLAMGLGLGLALALNRPGRWVAASSARPSSAAYVVSWVSVALLWMWLLDPDSGLVAGALRWAGASRGSAS